MRPWVALGALSAVVAVAMGAAGAHAVAADSQAAMWLDKASRYQMYHALGLVAVGLLSARPSALLHGAGAAFAAGTLLFSGSLYAMAFTGVAAGLVTPAGGLAFMLGWLLLALSALRPARGA